MMKGNALGTGQDGLLGAHLPLYLVEKGAHLQRLDRAQALNLLRPPFLPRRLNWGDPAIQPLLVNLGHQRLGQHAPAKQAPHGQLRHHQAAVRTGADRLLGHGRRLAA
jgi:hypothetical protein